MRGALSWKVRPWMAVLISVAFGQFVCDVIEYRGDQG
jgi:hypothetical protein